MMKPGNEANKKALGAALGALFELDDLGCAVERIVISGASAQIQLAAPPPKDTLKAYRAIRVFRGERRARMVAHVGQARVEWVA
jgi:hypothetical protein